MDPDMDFLQSILNQKPKQPFSMVPEAPIAPVSDKSTGRPLAASPEGSSQGVVPLPPPRVLTGQNQAPEAFQPDPEAALAPEAPEAPPAPAPTPWHQRDPNDILRESYSSAIKTAMDARQKDLGRLDSPQARSAAYDMMAAGGNLRSESLLGRGADLLKESTYVPIYQKTLKESAETVPALTKAQQDSAQFDPNSDLSRAAVQGFHSSEEIDDIAAKIEQNDGITFRQARKQVKDQTQGMSAKALGHYVESLKSGTDISKTEADAAKVRAEKRVWTEQANKYVMENSELAQQTSAKRSPNSATSVLVREAAVTQFPGVDVKYEEKTGKRWSNASFNEVAAFNPEIGKAVIPLIQWRIDHAREAEQKRVSGPGTQARPVGTSPGNIPNYAPLTEEDKKDATDVPRAAVNGMTAGHKVLSILEGKGVKGAMSVRLNSREGAAISDNLAYMIAAADRVSPGLTKDLIKLQQEISGQRGSTFEVSSDWFNGATTAIKNTLGRMHGDAYNKLAAKHIPDPEVFNKDMKAPPSAPPFGIFKSEAIQVEDKNAVSDPTQPERKKKYIYGYHFKDIGPFKNVVYFYQPLQDRWTVQAKR